MDKFNKRFNLEIQDALNWAHSSQVGHHEFSSSELEDLMYKQRTKTGNLLRTLLIKTRAGNVHNKKSKYCVNLITFKDMFIEFFGIEPTIIKEALMTREQKALFLTPQEIYDNQLAMLQRQKSDLIVKMAHDSGLTPVELMKMLKPFIALGNSTGQLKQLT